MEGVLDAALTVDVPAGIERGRPARQALADRAQDVACDATFHPLLVEALIDVRGIDLVQASRFGKRGRWRPCEAHVRPHVAGAVDVVAPFVSASTTTN